MTSKKTDILQGTLALLVLKTLASRRRLHGYAITAHIHGISGDRLRVEEGSLYPALHRMENRGWIDAEWGKTKTNRRARIYRLTNEGRERMRQEVASWSHFCAAVFKVVEPVR